MSGRGRARIERHGANHAAGGSDPIPGGGGGGGAKKLLICWGGSLPTIDGLDGLVWRVPYDTDESSFSFTVADAFARIEATQSSDVVFRIERSAGGGAFSPTTIDTLTVTAGNYEDSNIGIGGTLASGQLVRLVFVTTVTTLPQFEVELTASE